MRHNQNRRSRSRSRKGPNPLTRSYESSGPDGKVRGTAAHVAERYMQMARDALSSGDTVAAESFYQHAEHYNRIVMAAQPQFQPNQSAYGRDMDEEEDDGEGGESYDQPYASQAGGRDMQPPREARDGNRDGFEGDEGRYQPRREPQYAGPNNGRDQSNSQRDMRDNFQRDMRGENNGRGPRRSYDERGPDEMRDMRQAGGGEQPRVNGRQRFDRGQDAMNVSPERRGGERPYAPRAERTERAPAENAPFVASAAVESEARPEESIAEVARPARAPRKRRPRLVSDGGDNRAGEGEAQAPRAAEAINAEPAITTDGAAALTAFPDRG